MTHDANHNPPPPPVRESLVRREALPVLACAAVTVAAQLGLLVWARSLLPPLEADRLGLLLGLLALVVLAPALAASGRDAWGVFARAAAAIDASLVLLAVVAARGEALDAGGVLKLYLLWAAVGLAQTALVGLSRGPRGRAALAVAAVALVLGLAATPFWANQLVMQSRGAARRAVTSAVVTANPVLATAAALPGQAQFYWPERGILYEYTVLGRDVPARAAAWGRTALAYAAAAAILAGLAVLARRRGAGSNAEAAETTEKR